MLLFWIYYCLFDGCFFLFDFWITNTITYRRFLKDTNVLHHTNSNLAALSLNVVGVYLALDLLQELATPKGRHQIILYTDDVSVTNTI